MALRIAALLAFSILWGCATTPVATSGAGNTKAPTIEDAKAFMTHAEQALLDGWINRERADWVKSTYITFDTSELAARADAHVMKLEAELAQKAVAFDDLPITGDLKRKFKLLKLAMRTPAPSNAEKRNALARTKTQMEGMYGKGKYCPKTGKDKGKCLNLGDLSQALATSRDWDRLLDLWQGWRQIAVPMKTLYVRYMSLANEGARELGFPDVGTLWRSKYDMPANDFEAEVDRLWSQVEPLYRDLHCHVRAKLGELYGTDKVNPKAPIPAHILGNMWAQDWSYIADLLLPEKETGTAGYDLSKALVNAGYDEIKMVKTAEAFFVSLGLEPLPKTFWTRSMFIKPRDREVVCHASAWDIDWKDDLRIKMCIKVNEEEFTTIHHELGHNYYQRAYKHLSPLYTESANDGFHEALGDTISLSVTPKYLKQIGLMKKEPPKSLNPLMRKALEKVAFLPFGVVVDKWRWQAFSGRAKTSELNSSWWALRKKYQGIVPSVARGADAFDPGAKYHIPGNVPYMRYFLAHIQQFQFHRALCKVAGHEGPLHECSIYGNKAAGKRLNDMMEMGLSRPWPEAMKALTGKSQMDATAILDYFKPLHAWLKTQNKNRTCGW